MGAGRGGGRTRRAQRGGRRARKLHAPPPARNGRGPGNGGCSGRPLHALHTPAPLEPRDTPFAAAEHTVQQAVQWLRLAIETTGAAIIALGLVIAAAAFARALVRQRDPAYAADGYTGVRLTLARYLALALEFQLGADILSTAVAPTWTAIGKLGSIAVIRTALNYFLEREIREETRRAEAGER